MKKKESWIASFRLRRREWEFEIQKSNVKAENRNIPRTQSLNTSISLLLRDHMSEVSLEDPVQIYLKRFQICWWDLYHVL